MLHGTRLRYVVTYMGAFGGDFEKSMKLYGTAPWLGSLAREQQEVRVSGKKQLVKHSITADGRPSVSGGPDLKNSQAYPLRFGLAIAEAFANYHREKRGFGPIPTIQLTDEDKDILLKELPMPEGV